MYKNLVNQHLIYLIQFGIIVVRILRWGNEGSEEDRLTQPAIIKEETGTNVLC